MQEKKNDQNTATRPIIIGMGVLISAFFLYLAFQGLDFDEFLSSLQTIHIGWLFLAVVTYAGVVFCLAIRWQFLLRSMRLVPTLKLAELVAIGYMGNNVYPLRAGEALRLFLLKRDYNMPITGTAVTVVIERIFDGIVMLSFIVLGLQWVDVGTEAAHIRLILQIATPVFVIAVLVFFVLAMLPQTFRKLLDRVVAWLPALIGDPIAQLSDGVLIGLSSLRSPLYIAGSVLMSYVSWAIEALVYWFVMWAFGLDLGYEVALLVVGTANLAGLIPASPGNVGVYEAFASAVLIAVGIARGQAVAYAIVVHIVFWLPVTIVGFILLLRYGLGWRAITHAQELEDQVHGES